MAVTQNQFRTIAPHTNRRAGCERGIKPDVRAFIRSTGGSNRPRRVHVRGTNNHARTSVIPRFPGGDRFQDVKFHLGCLFYALRPLTQELLIINTVQLDLQVAILLSNALRENLKPIDDFAPNDLIY